MHAETLSVTQAAALLGWTEKCVRQRIARGQLPYRRLGARLFFIRTELMAFLASLDGVPVDEAMARARGKGAA